MRSRRWGQGRSERERVGRLLAVSPDVQAFASTSPELGMPMGRASGLPDPRPAPTSLRLSIAAVRLRFRSPPAEKQEGREEIE
jgi:hypothetical protein